MRLCECGCGREMTGRSGRARYLDGHRQRAYRKRVKVEMEAVGLPASSSLKVARASTPSPERNGDAQTRQDSRPAPRNIAPSDQRVTFTKLVKAFGWDQAVSVLTPKQRARVEAQRRS